jgi:hypothetical protein
MARPKKIKIEEMQVADGENIVAESKKPRTIYEVLGKKAHRYKTTDQEEYTNFLKSMSMAELHNHAYECGILPIDNRGQLTERLLREFCAQTSGYNLSAARRDSFQHLHDDPEKLSEIKQILSRGK